MKHLAALIVPSKEFENYPKILGRSLEEWAKYTCEEAGIKTILCTGKESISTYFKQNSEILSKVQGIFIWFADNPLYTKESLVSLSAFFKESKTEAVAAATSKSGLLLMENQAALSRAISNKGFDLEEISPLFCPVPEEETLRIQSGKEFALATNILKKRINDFHLEQGVLLLHPECTYIEADAKIEAGAFIYPGSHIRGNCKISSGCIIGPDTILEDTVVGENTQILKSVVLKSKIGSDTSVGPFAYIRPDSEIGSHVKIGDFVEVKKSVIGDGTKVSHLTYVGDAVVGSKVNFGCGTITVNYDGEKKHQTVIKDGAFIGCNTNLVAPVTVEKNAFIAAGSTITMDVPADALAIARQRQTNKEQWRTNRKDGKKS